MSGGTVLKHRCRKNSTILENKNGFDVIEHVFDLAFLRPYIEMGVLPPVQTEQRQSQVAVRFSVFAGGRAELRTYTYLGVYGTNFSMEFNESNACSHRFNGLQVLEFQGCTAHQRGRYP